MNKEEYASLYALEDTHWWFLAKRAFIKTILPKKEKMYRILDMGCGTGGLSAFLENWGSVDRVEGSQYALPFLQKRKLSYIHKDLMTYSGKKNAYDIVCLFDVLYHRNITDDAQIIRKGFSALVPGGVFCITDCAIPFLYSHHDKRMHARKRYYLSELTQLLEKQGFIVVAHTYIYFFVFPIFFVSRLINKIIPLPPVHQIFQPVNVLLTLVCQFEAFLLRFIRFPVGSSVLIKAIKPT